MGVDGACIKVAEDAGSGLLQCSAVSLAECTNGSELAGVGVWASGLNGISILALTFLGRAGELRGGWLIPVTFPGSGKVTELE